MTWRRSRTCWLDGGMLLPRYLSHSKEKEKVMLITWVD